VRDDQQAEAVVRQLVDSGYRPGAVLEQYVAGRLATVRLVHRSRPDVVIDLLFASSGIEPEIVEQAEALEVLPGLVVPVANVGHLIAMKLLARDDRNRPADADDLKALSEIATADDWIVARDGVRLIVQRGFHRGRDLEAALSSFPSSND
jgi:predicted nucleotidyltransferase